jgi:chromate reductase, NAD(P)H dehydrogenase (quinone)
MRILAISGSLRHGSSNAAVLRAAARVAPEGMLLTLFEGLAGLPHFNPDLDTEAPPPAVSDFRGALAQAEGLVISTPEYAHGLPGSLKNALDWVVSSGEIGGKPILLINASPSGGLFAQASLIETLSVMEGRVLKEATVVAPLARKKLDAEGALADPALLEALARGLSALADALHPR